MLTSLKELRKSNVTKRLKEESEFKPTSSGPESLFSTDYAKLHDSGYVVIINFRV